MDTASWHLDSTVKQMDLGWAERKLGHHCSINRVCEDSDGTVEPVL